MLPVSALCRFVAAFGKRRPIGGPPSDAKGVRSDGTPARGCLRRFSWRLDARANVAAAACVLWAVAVPAACGAADATDDVRSLTLSEAIALALTDSRAAVSARLDRDEQKFPLERADERYRPSVKVDAAANTGSFGTETADVAIGPSLRVPTGGSFQLSWRKPVVGEGNREASTNLSFSQPLLKGFGTDIDTAPQRMARMQESVNLGAFRDTAANIVGSVISAYRGALTAKRRVEIARDALARAQRQLEINRALVEAGRMATQDLVQTEADVANKEYELSDSENGLVAANADLVNVLDLDEGTRLEAREEPTVRPERPNLNESLETAFALRTDWLRARTGVEQARLNLRIAQNNLLPDLSLNASAWRGGGQERTEWSGGLNLTLPLWNEEPKRALAIARNDLRQAQMNREERRQSIRIEVRQAVRNVEVALRQIDLARQGRTLAERKLDVERRKLQQGLSSAFQMGRFEEDLVGAQRRELDAVVSYRDALDSLDLALGTTLDRWGIDVKRVGQ